VTDEIVLTLPDEQDFHDVAHLVVGGLAVRLNLTFDNLEDVQVALEGLLAGTGGDVTVAIRLGGDDGLVLSVGPFDCERLRAELEDDAHLGLGRVLATVTDGVEVEERGDGCWVELRKRVERIPR